MGVRGKLFVVAVLLVMAVGTISGVYVEFSLRAWLENRAEEELWRQARVAKDLVEIAPEQQQTQIFETIVWRLQQSLGDRVTLINRDGQLLADSQIVNSDVSQAENHLSRLEVQLALNEGSGMSRRLSETFGTAMLYAALPFHREHQQGVVRVAMSLAEVDEAIHKLRFILTGAGFVGLLTALLASGLTSHFASKALRDLMSHASNVAKGRLPQHLIVWPEDEIGAVAGSFNALAAKLEGVVDLLAKERNQVTAILESMTEAVLAVDPQENITLINGAAIQLLGASQQPLGQTFLATIAPKTLRDLLQKARDGQAVSAAFELKQRYLLVRVTPLDEKGSCVVVMHDMTELRRLENVRREFIANVSHELRTPVSIIQANAETLLDGALENPIEAKIFLTSLLRNAERLGRIIADLLDIAQVEAGELKLKIINTPLHDICRKAMDAILPQAQKKEIKLRCDILSQHAVEADLQALDQILLNLLANAVKYTPEKGNIALQAYEKSGKMRIEVLDDGPGIAPEHHNYIFERFYRVDRGRSRQTGGTGLGLSIAKHLSEAMHGEIGIENNKLQGSCFWFTLPLAS